MHASAISIYVIFIGYAILALTPTGSFWFMAMSGLIIAVCLPVANVSIQKIMQTIVPMQMQGRVTSVTMALASGAQPLGMILSGIIVGFTRTANLFIGCAVLGIVMLTVSWIFTDIKHIEKTREPGA